MQITTISAFPPPPAASLYPRAHALPSFPSPAFDLGRDTVEITDANRTDELDGIHLDIATTARNEDDEPIVDHYAARSQYDSSYLMKPSGFVAALDGARTLSKTHEAVAVVKAANGTDRFLVPLGVWNPYDESQLTFSDVGGAPHLTGPDDYLLLHSSGELRVEAVVFDGGSQWINFLGHPVRLPKA